MSETRAYLIRFQRVESENCWRASMENAHTGEINLFAHERELLLYLLDTLKTEPAAADKSQPQPNGDPNDTTK